MHVKQRILVVPNTKSVEHVKNERTSCMKNLQSSIARLCLFCIKKMLEHDASSCKELRV